MDGLVIGGVYALKILVPPSGLSKRFRDGIYRLGFQAPFALQVNPQAARAGALWQKVIRRAAGVRFGDEQAVVDVLATLIDTNLGSCGEISEWVEGRTWRYEVDDHLFQRGNEKAGQENENLGSPEYCAKKAFLAGFVKLLHELGAPELARQYEWWTCKSQPNVLKRMESHDNAAGGLTAVDFRAGLALLPYLPMSPGDVPLIGKGIARGSLVQFDRGNLRKLEAFVRTHTDRFSDMQPALEELKAAEKSYRNAQIDLTHNHVRLLGSRRLWSGIFKSAVTGWRVGNVIDDAAFAHLGNNRFLTLLFAFLGAIPALGLAGAVVLLVGGWIGTWPFWPALGAAVAVGAVSRILGRALRKVWARRDYCQHLWALLTERGYLSRAFRGHVAEAMIRWHRAGRVSPRLAEQIADHPGRYLLHRPLGLLPAFLHRMLTDADYAKQRLAYVFVRPIKLYFNAALREQWLQEMVAEGRRRHMLTDDDAAEILRRIEEPFIQKYLKSLAVHVCTLPITQIVSIACAILYIWINWGTQPFLVLFGKGWAIVAIFQFIPISPGSLVRGLYVLYLVISERDFKNYNIAVFLGFFKYVGYLAFPIQMAYHYPALARFMAAHWATGFVHVVPVFGEHGALLEHGVFDLFYNYPLTVRRRMARRAALRESLTPRIWHAAIVVAAAALLMGVLADACRAAYGTLPTIWNVWPAVLLVPIAVGVLVILPAGGLALSRRIRMAVISGAAAGMGYAIVTAALVFVPFLGGSATNTDLVGQIGKTGAWSVFLFTLLTTVSALVTEINLPEPKTARG